MRSKTMKDEEIESAIAILKAMMAAQAVGSAHLIEMKAEPAALPAPGAESMAAVPEPTPKRKPNRLMMEADTAIGPRERKPRKVPSPASTSTMAVGLSYGGDTRRVGTAARQDLGRRARSCGRRSLMRRLHGMA